MNPDQVADRQTARDGRKPRHEPRWYRGKAVECRAKAAAATDPGVVLAWLELGWMWSTLAGDVERRGMAPGH